jgi:hypothetical protein
VRVLELDMASVKAIYTRSRSMAECAKILGITPAQMSRLRVREGWPPKRQWTAPLRTGFYSIYECVESGYEPGHKITRKEV